MIVNHSYGFIFIHTPKAAGTSVTSKLSAFTRYCDQEIGGTNDGQSVARYYAKRFGLRKHSPAREVRRIVGDDTWTRYFTFGFVRNPYARLVSAYGFLRQWPGCPDRVRQILDKFDNVEKFLDSGYWSAEAGPDNIFLPQTFWLNGSDDATGNLVDFVGRTERLERDLGAILARIDGTQEESGSLDVPTLNRSKTPETADLWTPARRARVEDRYGADFAAFYPDATPPGTS
ncbi:MAG: sulfotransferase family 2 domain-containing protein [Marinibacterium sp.]